MDWKNARMQYEIFGISTRELAEDYDVDQSLIDYAVSEEEWQVQSLATEDAADSLQTQNDALAAIKTNAMSPLYMRLEAALISKCLQFVNNLDTEEPGNIARLKVISDILTQRQPVKNPNDGNNGDGSMTLRILTKSMENGGLEQGTEIKFH